MAYNPASDSNCQAWWRLEDGALTTDSSGKGNALTNSGVSSSSTHKEGSHSGEFAASSSDRMYIADADLSSSFPTKSGGTKSFTVCFWMRLNSVPNTGSYHGCIGKYVSSTNKRSWVVTVRGVSSSVQSIQLSVSDDGSTATAITHTSDLSTGVWYHVAVTWDNDATGTASAYRIRIWDDTAGAILGTDKTGTTAIDLALYDNAVEIGSWNNAASSTFLDGLLDDVLVFNRVLSTDEIDEIRSQTFGSASTVEISGSASAVSGISATASATRQIAGASAGQSGFTVSASIDRAIVGQAGGQSTLSGTLSVVRPVSGAIASGSSLAGGPSIARSVAGTIATQSVVSGATRVSRGIGGNVEVLSWTHAVPSVSRPLAGIVESQSSVSGSLAGAGESLAAVAGFILLKKTR